jgi:hypothetical protein
MTTPEMNIAITSDDMNQVIAENPMVGLQLKIAALARKCEEQQVRISELTKERDGGTNLKAGTKPKKGS